MRNRTIISIKKSVSKTKTDRLQDKIIYFEKRSIEIGTPHFPLKFLPLPETWSLWKNIKKLCDDSME